MGLILTGLALALTGLALLLAQTMRLIEPGILLALAAFISAFLGIFVGVAGIVRRR
ncbi:hypothetical protein ABC977_17825 [Thioalkalicoccus limnaeus]|uniref:Uncharacterized protein n=1 Tax=Thioalkalicoccus limnaeus TaxID=120681 RepID=A0ABV4BJV9_9GAMM